MKKLPLVVLAVALLAGTSPAAPPPNVVFVLADDFGIDSVGAYGGPYATPAIDRLAAGGMRFDWMYCTPVCGPTRAQLMTGQYPFRSGCIDIDRTCSLQVEQVPSLPRLFSSAGYVTGMAGKWRQVRPDAGAWGFQDWMMSPTGGGWYWRNAWTENGKEVTREGTVYFPDEMMRFAVRFIQDNCDRPFFLYYAMTTPHVPIEPTPDSEPGTTDQAALYEDNIDYADKQVRVLVEALEHCGVLSNTLFIVTGDNGSIFSKHTIDGKGLAGGKVSMLNGGAHVPFIAHWPGVVPAGTVNTNLADFTDVLPTFAEVAGSALPEGKTLDGRSFLPQLRGEEGRPRDWVFVQMGHYFWVRNRGYALNESGVLFDLSGLPWEQPVIPPDTDDAAARAARDELKAVLDRLNPAGGATWDEWRGFGNRGPGKKPPRGAGGYELQ